MDYISKKEASEIWGISDRRIQKLRPWKGNHYV